MTAPSASPALAPRRPGARGTEVRVTQLRVIRSEWTKLTSLRSTIWTLIAAVVIMVGLGAIISSLTAQDWADYDAMDRLMFDPTATSLSGMFLAQLAVGVLGVLVITGEYSTGMIRASLGVVPRRLPVLWAKVLVFAAASFALMLAACLVAFVLGQSLLSPENIDVALSDQGVLRSVVGTAFYVTAVGLLGLALGAILRSTPAAIAVLFGVLLVLPALVQLLPSSLRGIEKYLPSGGGSALMGVVPDPDVLSPGRGLLVLAVYLVVGLATAGVALTRRDA